MLHHWGAWVDANGLHTFPHNSACRHNHQLLVITLLLLGALLQPVKPTLTMQHLLPQAHRAPPSHSTSTSSMLAASTSYITSRYGVHSFLNRSVLPTPTHDRWQRRAKCSSQSTDGTVHYSDASMADLQIQLDLAIRNEDYGLAAQLRDQLTCVRTRVLIPHIHIICTQGAPKLGTLCC